MKQPFAVAVSALCLATVLGACSSPETHSPPLTRYSPESSESSGASTSTGEAEDVDLSVFDSAGSLPPAANDNEFNRQVTEWNTAFASCLNDRGWTEIAVTAPDTPNVALDLAGIDGQFSAFNADARECAHAVGPSPTSPPLTAEYAAAKYADRLRLKTCLEAEDYAISDPPTQESFTDDLLNGRPTWDPLRDVGEGHSGGEYRSFEELYGICPWE